jgi:hypothetical protein
MMWPFAKSQQVFEEPVEPESVVDREAEAHQVVVELKMKLAALDADMLAFKSLHKIRTDRFSRLLGVESTTIGGFAEIEREWRILVRRRDSLISQWHAALYRWAELKEAAKAAKNA